MLGREEINTLERTRAAIIKHEEWYRGLPEGSLEKKAEDQSLIPLKLGLIIGIISYLILIWVSKNSEALIAVLVLGFLLFPPSGFALGSLWASMKYGEYDSRRRQEYLDELRKRSV